MARVVAMLAVLTLAATGCGGPEQTEREQSPPATEPLEVQVDAEDYVFEGIPATLPAGEVMFVLDNQGFARHELSFGHLLGDESVEEVVRLPESQLHEAIERLPDGIPPIPTGEFAHVTLNLRPGRYAYVCFVGDGLGRPHAFAGMVGEFTVA